MNITGRTSGSPQAGFTLVESMIVLVIVVILITIVVPGFRDVLVRSRLSSKLNDFVAAMQIARSEAVKYTRVATLCQSNNGTACNGSSWLDGWLVWVDTNGNGSITLDNSGTADVNESEIMATGRGGSGYAFAADSDAATEDLHDDATIVFRPDGTAALPGALSTGAMMICIDKQIAGLVSLDRTGRPVAKKLSSTSGCP